MNPNPYAPPQECDATSEPAPLADISRLPPVLVGCLSLLLVPLVLFFSCAGLMARIDSDEELMECVIIDVLVGFALFGLLMLHAGWIFPRARWRVRIASALLAAIFCAGTLAGSHFFSVYMRKHAIDELRRQSPEAPP